MHSINIRFLYGKIQEMEVWLHGKVIDLACTRVCIQASVVHTHTHTRYPIIFHTILNQKISIQYYTYK